MVNKRSERTESGAEKRTKASDASRSSVQSLAKGFRILEAFTVDREQMTLTEVADAADLDTGTAYRMLKTLVDIGYVTKVPGSRRYSLTLKVLDLGFHAIAHRDLRSVARPALRTLVNDISEAASFAVLNGADVLYIERVRAGIARLGVDIRLGTTVPALQSIIGHCILAFQPPGEVRRIATLPSRETIAPLRPIGWDDIEPVLADIRRDGFALRPSTLSEGLRILAVPVMDRDGIAIGAISVASPVARSAEADFLAVALDPTRAAASLIARALEASGSVTASR